MRLFLIVMSLAACAALAAPEAATDIFFWGIMLTGVGLVMAAARHRSESRPVSD